MQGISVPPMGTVIPSGGSFLFTLTLFITWRSFYTNISPSSDLAKGSGMCRIIFVLWLVFFMWTEMTCSLCWLSLKHSSFSSDIRVCRGVSAPILFYQPYLGVPPLFGKIFILPLSVVLLAIYATMYQADTLPLRETHLIC